MSTSNTQEQLDRLNAQYWNEPCGTHLARRTNTADDYAAFDKKYFDQYPFLKAYLDKFSGRVVEWGIGYGTVGRYLSSRCEYMGLDIAQEPVNILERSGIDAFVKNVLEPLAIKDYFDGVVSIGCLHHTGNIPLALKNIRSSLKPGGRALIMLYNAEAEKLAVDRNTKGEKAPCIDYTRMADIDTLFAAWDMWEATEENGKNRDIYVEAMK